MRISYIGRRHHNLKLLGMGSRCLTRYNNNNSLSLLLSTTTTTTTTYRRGGFESSSSSSSFNCSNHLNSGSIRLYSSSTNTAAPSGGVKLKPGAKTETVIASKELQDRIKAIPVENYRNFSIVAHVVCMYVVESKKYIYSIYDIFFPLLTNSYFFLYKGSRQINII